MLTEVGAAVMRFLHVYCGWISLFQIGQDTTNIGLDPCMCPKEGSKMVLESLETSIIVFWEIMFWLIKIDERVSKYTKKYL